MCSISYGEYITIYRDIFTIPETEADVKPCVTLFVTL